MAVLHNKNALCVSAFLSSSTTTPLFGSSRSSSDGSTSPVDGVQRWARYSSAPEKAEQKQQQQQHQQKERRNEDNPHHTTRQVTFDLSKRMPTPASRWRKIFRKKTIGSQVQRLTFSYDINILDLPPPPTVATADHHSHNTTTRDDLSMVHPLFEGLYLQLLESFDIMKKDKNLRLTEATTTTTGVILIHPIGVGIGKWFYNRLLNSLYNLEEYKNTTSLDTVASMAGSTSKQHQLIVVAPDLLGSGTACNPVNKKLNEDVHQVPLLKVQDWAAQTSRLMANLEKEYPNIGNWCLVANGGCSPIALKVAAQSVRAQQTILPNKLPSKEVSKPSNGSSFEPHLFQRPVTNVILSSVPRLPFFLPTTNNSKQGRREKLEKVQKSYKTLCGPAGRAFWWYALRKQGKFIQSFSERNLVANADNLGDDWTPNCVATARMYNGKSRYSTFSFLAGSLQLDGCRESLEILRRSGVTVDVIQGRDRRRNRAKSVFWQKLRRQSKNKKRQEEASPPSPPEETLPQFLKRNGNRGEVLQVGGRISLAHEDAPGYAEALVNILDLD